MTSSAVIIVAAGRGNRFGGDLPKQYAGLAGAPILRHTVRAFLGHPRIGAVRVVYHPDDHDLYARAVDGLDLLSPVAGGASRQDSVRNGLESLAGLAPDRVLIHDAARPFIDAATIDRVLDALDEVPGAIPALPVTDTLKRGDASRVAGTVDRAGLWRAQTPQGFRFDAILEAHRALAGQDLTDDAALAEASGLAVARVDGSEDNVKITTQHDLARARALWEKTVTRVGTGFDVHRFTAGDHVWLCGLAIPHTHTLAGHSDADVALHALTDAVLGAIGDGDIGSHFPPSDDRWKGAASDRFLAHAVDLVRARGGRVEALDVTIICERPKIGPHRAAMVARVAQIAGLPPGRVSVKGTTTEGLGFTGRGEGIAAQAAATVSLPPGDDDAGQEG
ncbi:MAG: bifunctional 2-C-methyl-D-erythritol 4-phosphate cytidylyltransferase/2-C-methyl-D-erythritol 2,4-cyclodiphosphate synthase [Rhodobacterales bacterium]|nr:bifunctional 2-C-methyl-D-erythritol 4-phosphate cytidylyltransferase/2-C-methyl-D-erythritol 2,4-cyclodiphosphate synthase [Rhodobacterales bacterium]